MKEHWRSDPCYERDHGVDGTLCSFIVYLSEVSSLHNNFWHINPFTPDSAKSKITGQRIKHLNKF